MKPRWLPRVTMTAPLGPGVKVPVPGERPPAHQDAPALAALMLHAYRGTIDCKGETFVHTFVEMSRMFAGEYGPFDARSSRVVERDGRLASAVLITGWEQRPFVLYAMTAPDFKRQGLARAGMVNAMSDLHAAGEKTLSLVVTVANAPAYELYRQLGFVGEG